MEHFKVNCDKLQQECNVCVCAYKREYNIERDIIKGLQIRFITNLLIYFSLATKLEEF